ncbi:MAG: MarR family transcriptional regulator [Lachnospiraceae bacterium]|nr:MarR family transcriptional regulator [Lachnospiraceae bacterium]
MLATAFKQLYEKLRLHFYMSIFSNCEDKEETLTTMESFSMEVINALGKPTVARFAKVLGLSSPNAAHRIKTLIQKGYIEKVQSEEDGREFYLKPTKKYTDYCLIKEDYINLLMDRCKQRFEPDDYNKLEEMLTIISKELMPEINGVL